MASDAFPGDLSKRLAALNLGNDYLWIRVDKGSKGEVAHFLGHASDQREVEFQSPVADLDLLPKDCFEKDNQIHCKRDGDQQVANLLRSVKTMLGVAKSAITLFEMSPAPLMTPVPDNYSPTLLDPQDRILEVRKVERVQSSTPTKSASATFFYRYLVDTTGDQVPDVTLVVLEIFLPGKPGTKKTVTLVRLPEAALAVLPEDPPLAEDGESARAVYHRVAPILPQSPLPPPMPEPKPASGCGCSLGSRP